MKYRKLRIAWSVAWGAVAVLLILLWVRSYQMLDGVFGPVTDKVAVYVDSLLGRVMVTTVVIEPPSQFMPAKVRHLPMMEGWKSKGVGGFLGFNFERTTAYSAVHASPTRTTVLTAPYWFLVSLCAGIGAVSWARWSKGFSLRTLLIATTLAAVVLGIIVWMLRAG